MSLDCIGFRLKDEFARASTHRLPMYPVQVVVIAVVGLFFSALLLALVLWLLS
jgi:hypothetical protein